ncbi:hypothetical protein Tco_1537595 [Tanacetum coccineum]
MHTVVEYQQCTSTKGVCHGTICINQEPHVRASDPPGYMHITSFTFATSTTESTDNMDSLQPCNQTWWHRVESDTLTREAPKLYK